MGCQCLRQLSTKTLWMVAIYLGVAEPGTAPALGAGDREFESLYPDLTSDVS